LDHGRRLTIEAPPGYLDDVGLGDSIALNGACMTVTSLDLPPALHGRHLGRIAGPHRRPGRSRPPHQPGKALRAHDRLGGHIVSGHVDGVGTVTRFAQVGESWELCVLAPPELGKYLAYKGSITVNGVSLTVNRVSDSAHGCEFSINLIPHTVENTALGTCCGQPVNLEIDTVARYVERMLGQPSPQGQHA
jgi:riboflavin synthase